MDEVDEEAVKILNEIFIKAASDPEFRKALLSNPDSVLGKYQLSDETKQTILNAMKEMGASV